MPVERAASSVSVPFEPQGEPIEFQHAETSRPESPASASDEAGDVASVIASFEHNNDYDPSKIQEGRINRALIGAPQKNSDYIPVGDRLNLKNDPSLEEAKPSLLKRGLSRVGKLVDSATGASRKAQKSVRMDAATRTDGLNKRERELDRAQDNPDAVAARQRLRRTLGEGKEEKVSVDREKRAMRDRQDRQLAKLRQNSGISESSHAETTES